MSSGLPLAGKVTLIHQSLREAGIPHAIGGAMALAYYGEPRLTVDIDVNVFVTTDELSEVLEVLEAVGGDANVDPEVARRNGQVYLRWGRNPVDVFFAYDPFHEAMSRRTRTVPFGEGTIPILAPEHLIVCKAAFDRTKDWIDIEQMLAGVENLDREELDLWLDRVLGPESKATRRVQRLWDQTR